MNSSALESRDHGLEITSLILRDICMLLNGYFMSSAAAVLVRGPGRRPPSPSVRRHPPPRPTTLGTGP